MKIFLFHNLDCFSIFKLFSPKNFARETVRTLRQAKHTYTMGDLRGAGGIPESPR